MRSAAMRTPSESTSPKPSRSPIKWISSTIDSWLPKCRSMPPVSSSVMMPRSKSSMAKAMVTPGRHRVEAVLVGGAVGGDDGVGVGDAGGAAERVERLVLGALGHDAGVGARLREAHLAAGHGALGAGGAPGAARRRWLRRRWCPRTSRHRWSASCWTGRCRARCSSPRCRRCPRARTASRAPGCPSWRRACACAPP